MFDKKKFTLKANKIRKDILEMSLSNGGHISTSFSCVEILVTLYHGGILNISPKDPHSYERDRFILSKGHSETGFYAVLADMNFFPSSWLQEYRQKDCKLGGHADHRVQGVELTTGSLGHGLGFAAGISLAAKINNKLNTQFVLLGDAECTEGSIWEAAFFATKHKLDNLIAIIDRNNIGSLDFVSNFTELEPLNNKWKSFGWDVEIVDGHNFDQLFTTFNKLKSKKKNKPKLLIAKTIKGKGVSFIENDPIWHVKQLTDVNEINQARMELNKIDDKII